MEFINRPDVPRKFTATNLQDMINFRRAFRFTPEKVEEVTAKLRADLGGDEAAAARAKAMTVKEQCDLMFQYLPEMFDSSKAQGWAATIHFKLDDVGDYTVTVSDGEAPKASSATGLAGTARATGGPAPSREHDSGEGGR